MAADVRDGEDGRPQTSAEPDTDVIDTQDAPNTPEDRSNPVELIALAITVFGIVVVATGAGFYDWRIGLLAGGSLSIALGLLLGFA